MVKVKLQKYVKHPLVFHETFGEIKARKGSKISLHLEQKINNINKEKDYE